MKKMIPLFVKAPPGDHKCGGCTMFVPSPMPSACIIVLGPISADGTCMYQAPGKNTTADKIHKTRMNKQQSNYGEMAAPVNCSTCQFYDLPNHYCKLWEGTAEPVDCCMAHDTPDYK